MIIKSYRLLILFSVHLCCCICITTIAHAQFSEPVVYSDNSSELGDGHITSPEGLCIGGPKGDLYIVNGEEGNIVQLQGPGRESPGEFVRVVPITPTEGLLDKPFDCGTLLLGSPFNVHLMFISDQSSNPDVGGRIAVYTIEQTGLFQLVSGDAAPDNDFQPRGIAVNDTLEKVFILSNDDKIVSIDLSNPLNPLINVELADVAESNGGEPTGAVYIAFNSDMGSLFITNELTMDIREISQFGNILGVFSEMPEADRGIAVGSVVAANSFGELVVFDEETGENTQIFVLNQSAMLRGMTNDSKGQIFISDTGNNVIWTISPPPPMRPGTTPTPTPTPDVSPTPTPLQSPAPSVSPAPTPSPDDDTTSSGCSLSNGSISIANLIYSLLIAILPLFVIGMRMVVKKYGPRLLKMV